MKRPFKSWQRAPSSPLTDAFEVSPSDSTDLTAATRAVYVGVPGDLRVTMLSGDVVTFTALPAGWHPIRVVRIWQTGTTAAGICGCW